MEPSYWLNLKEIELHNCTIRIILLIHLQCQFSKCLSSSYPFFPFESICRSTDLCQDVIHFRMPPTPLSSSLPPSLPPLILIVVIKCLATTHFIFTCSYSCKCSWGWEVIKFICISSINFVMFVLWWFKKKRVYFSTHDIIPLSTSIEADYWHKSPETRVPMINWSLSCT